MPGSRSRSSRRRLGRAVSTVSREVAANGGREGYRAWRAHQRARERARRPKRLQAGLPPAGRPGQRSWLQEWWSPEQIARRLRIEYPHDPDDAGEPRDDLPGAVSSRAAVSCAASWPAACAPGGPGAAPAAPVMAPGKIPDMVMISERPAEAADRAVPGHWEGDLIIGKDGRSAVGTLVERTTRFVLLLHLPARPRRRPGRAAPCGTAIGTLPGTLARSRHLGPGHQRCPGTPRSPSPPASRSTSATRTRPGSADRTRTPTGCSASTCPRAPTSPCHTAADLAAIAASLNGRPRKTLGYMTPSEKLAEFLAHTA